MLTPLTSVAQEDLRPHRPPDGRLVPFDTYNLFYRGALDQTRLQPIRKEIEEELAKVCLLE